MKEFPAASTCTQGADAPITARRNHSVPLGCIIQIGHGDLATPTGPAQPLRPETMAPSVPDARTSDRPMDLVPHGTDQTMTALATVVERYGLSPAATPALAPQAETTTISWIAESAAGSSIPPAASQVLGRLPTIQVEREKLRKGTQT